jgi:hypothetical protein
MGVQDFRHVLQTTAQLSDAYKKLNVNLVSPDRFLKEVLFQNILLADAFDPTNPNDIQYLWDVYYSFQWNKQTKSRFIKDVRELKNGRLSVDDKIVISDPIIILELEQTCNLWLDLISNTSADHIQSFVEERSL